MIPATDLFTRFEQEMRLRNYAHTTIKTYRNCLRVYVRWLHPIFPRDATNEQIHEFLLFQLTHGRSTAWLSQCISALKFLYIVLYRRHSETVRLQYPRKQQRLPYVPTRIEVLGLAQALSNRKHRLAVLLLYSSGLRASELVALNICDVSLQRRTVQIHAGKGSRDRITVISDDLLSEIAWISGERSSRAPLIPSQGGGRWTTRSLQKVIRRAADRAGLPKRLTPHSLRHAFATHLLEGGTELRYIQSLMGHKSIETTSRYVRVRDPRALNLKSPL